MPVMLQVQEHCFPSMGPSSAGTKSSVVPESIHQFSEFAVQKLPETLAIFTHLDVLVGSVSGAGVNTAGGDRP